MAILGLRDTSNFVAGQRPLNWRAGILMLYPNGKAPLVGLSSAMKSRTVDDPEFNWWEKALDSRRFALTATIDDGTTDSALTVASGAMTLKEGDVLLMEETEEVMLVSADPSVDTSIPVVREFAGSTGVAVDHDGAGVNPNFFVIGSAYEEGSNAPTGVNFDPSKIRNYTQIFRNTLEATRTAMKTRLRTPDAVREAKRECLEYHSIAMERAFWHGVASEGTRNGKPIRTTAGIDTFIAAANKRVQSGALDMDELEEYLHDIFLFGSNEKMAFCGNRAALTINQAIRKNSQIQITSGIKEFGMNVWRLTSPYGELVMKSHPLFNLVTGGTTTAVAYPGLNSTMYVLDMANLGYCPFTDADTKYESDLQENGMDGMKAGYITEAGIEVHHPTTHFRIRNLVAAKVDD